MCDPIMACELPVAVKAKLMLSAIHCMSSDVVEAFFPRPRQ